MQVLPERVHVLVVLQDHRRQRLQGGGVLALRHRAQHRDQVLFLVVVVQVGRLLEVLQHGTGRLARLLVGAVLGQVREQALERAELLADASVTMLEDGDRLVETGSGFREEIIHLRFCDKENNF